MTSNEIRSKFLEFFERKGHKIIPSASLIPENDPSVLFTTAGMQQFKLYYTNPELAKRDFGVNNVVTVQKCVRTGDIEEVGDNNHLTFFEMLGNFSFGGYGRKEAIEYAHEFITKEMELKISYVTIYEGSQNIPRDGESEKIWQSLGVTNIHEEDMEKLFWGPTGDSGPCGLTTEIYCKNASGEDVEIWNIVFNEYFSDSSREKLDAGVAKLTKLPVLGIDTGMGLERLVSVIQNKKSVYNTDLFDNEETKEERIIADHTRAIIFMISDGVRPSNKGSGYVLRRLMRTVASYKNIDIEKLVEIIIEKLRKQYFDLNKKRVILEFKNEKAAYEQAYNSTKNEIKKHQGKILTGYGAFNISSTLGAKVSDIIKIAKETEVEITDNFNKEFEEASQKHQELSRTSSAGMWKGGLVDNDEETKKLHTATHLLNQALRIVLGEHVVQKGSNINQERLRFDFVHPRKLTEEEKSEVERIVNQKIDEGLPVGFVEMPRIEAEKIATHSFNEKYGDIVTVYSIGDETKGYFSREFCGGPHVTNTKELADNQGGALKRFKIQKEEAVSAGVRRIKAILY
jgi:alanyl-tRNA synthetase